MSTITSVGAFEPTTIDFNHDHVRAVLVRGVWIRIHTKTFEIQHRGMMESPQGLMPDDTWVSAIDLEDRYVVIRLGSIDAFEFNDEEEEGCSSP